MTDRTPPSPKTRGPATRAAVLAAGAALLAGTAVWAASPGPPVQISGASPFGPLSECGDAAGTPAGINFLDSEVEPWLDVNPDNPSNIVAFWQQDRWSNGGARGNVAGVSLDGGATWDIVPVPGLTDCTGGPYDRASDPWVSFAPDGTLHQISLVFDADPAFGSFGPNGLAVSRSVDGGLTWTDPILIIEDDRPNILNDKQSITADPTDSNLVYAVWDRLQVPPGSVINPENVIGFGFKSPFHFARSTDGGSSWERPRRIYDPGANNQTIGHQLLVLPDARGTLVDLFDEILNFRNDDGGFQFDFTLALLRSPDKGVRWLPRGRPIRAAKLLPRTMFAPPPGFIGVYHPDDMTVPIRTADILFDVAIDPSAGTLYAVWQDSRFSNAGDFSDPGLLIDEVAFAQSSDGGFTWSAPVKINRTPTSLPLGNRQAFVPSVAVAGDGTVAVTYYDFRNNGVESAGLTDHWLIRCQAACDNPASWAIVDEVRMTDAPFDIGTAPFAGGHFLGDYVGLAGDDTDVLPAFAQTHDGDPASIFFQRVAP